MDPWFAKGIVLAASIALVAIRAPHGQRSRSIAVVESRRGKLEILLLALAWLSFFGPLVWIASPWLAFADYPLHPAPLAAGTVCYAVGLWLFWRSHRDLGRNWSITLELRQEHALVTHGLYRRVRHPMYLALLVYSLGQALALPNAIAGPLCASTMLLLVALRMTPEERMMRDRFGEAWADYASRTQRLFPGLW